MCYPFLIRNSQTFSAGLTDRVVFTLVCIADLRTPKSRMSHLVELSDLKTIVKFLFQVDV